MSAYSVVMATYHGEVPRYLQDCLSSLERQTEPADEIVLVRDGAIGAELQGVIDMYSHLPLVLVDHLGSGRLGGALALGVLAASNEIIGRMDSDDVARPDRFAKQLGVFNAANDIVLGGQIEEFDRKPGDLGIQRCVPLSVGSTQLRSRNPMNHMTVMYSREAVLSAGNYLPLAGFEDWYLWLRMARCGVEFRNVSEVLVDARIGNEFEKRRSGLQYAGYECSALLRFWRDGLISSVDLARNTAMRVPLRLMPSGLAKLLYGSFLRRSNGD